MSNQNLIKARYYKNLLNFSYTVGSIIGIIICLFVGIGLFLTNLATLSESARIVVNSVGSVFCLFSLCVIGYKTYIRKQLSFIFNGIGVKNYDGLDITKKQMYEIFLVVYKILCLRCKLYNSLISAESAVLKALKNNVLVFVSNIDANAYNSVFNTKYKEVFGYCNGGYLCIIPKDPLYKSSLIHEIFHRLIDEQVINTCGLDPHTWMSTNHIEDEFYLNKFI